MERGPEKSHFKHRNATKFEKTNPSLVTFTHFADAQHASRVGLHPPVHSGLDHLRASVLRGETMIETGKEARAISIAERFFHQKEAWTEGALRTTLS
ncbi:hypothetical protein [Pendulispora albinea]|uniref:Uncharacterized protein n=1 Tax=Pendulispora albinea TaxID=2741071 RepID=A0ABZ2LZJ0_9BACT